MEGVVSPDWSETQVKFAKRYLNFHDRRVYHEDNDEHIRSFLYRLVEVPCGIRFAFETEIEMHGQDVRDKYLPEIAHTILSNEG